MTTSEGEFFHSLRIKAPASRTMQLKAWVRRTWRGAVCDACGHNVYVGLSVQPKSADDRADFAKLVCAVLFPNINWGDHESDAIWSVLEGAGYFDLSGKDAQAFVQKKDAFLKFNAQLSLAPALGHQLAWQSGGRPMASIASCRAFGRAHLLHHLGKVNRSGQDRTSLRDVLVCSVELTKHDADIDYICAYLNKAVPFHRQSAIPFATFFAHTEQAACLSLQLFELQAEQAARATSGACLFDARVANEAERALLVDTLARRFGPSFCRAFDRTQASLDWSKSGRDWAQVGLERRRAVFVAAHGKERPVAAAIVEMASVGSNLFHIFDAVTVTQLDETISEERLSAAHETLIAQAGRWFLQHGVRRFITPVFAAEHNLQAPSGATDLGSGALWIVERSLFCLLQEYWHLQL